MNSTEVIIPEFLLNHINNLEFQKDIFRTYLYANYNYQEDIWRIRRFQEFIKNNINDFIDMFMNDKINTFIAIFINSNRIQFYGFIVDTGRFINYFELIKENIKLCDPSYAWELVSEETKNMMIFNKEEKKENK
jgi:hypothetical protein